MTDRDNTWLESNKSVTAFAVILGLAYLYGVLSPQHYSPSVLDLYIGLGITIALSLGLLIAISQNKITHISHTAILCMFFALLIICQPLLSHIDYSDSLLFPSNALLLMACLSIVIANIKNKSNIISSLFISLYIGGLLTVLTQILQLLPLSYPSWLTPLIFYGTDTSRPYGNIGQPNQAAYVIAMAMVASGYLYIKSKQHYLSLRVWLFVGLMVSILFLAIGQGLTSSRGGLILSVIACIAIAVLNRTAIKHRVVFSATLAVTCITGSWLGTQLLLHYADYKQTALGRVISPETSRPLRWYLQEQAWLTFSTDWLTGAGWGNLPKVALANAETLNRFVFATNTHFLPSQIAAELGLLGMVGLLGLGFVIIKALIQTDRSLETKTLIVLIFLSLLYSGSEYPFWYMRFLFLFTCFIALIDRSKMTIRFNIKWFLIGYLVIVALGSVFYLKHYRQYAAVDYLIKRDDVAAAEAQVLVEQLNNVYGFSKFKEVMIYDVISVDSDNIGPAIVLGNRVIANYLDPELMVKQAKLLALRGSHQESLKLYKAACHYEFAKYCGEVKNELQWLSVNQSTVFSSIYDEFIKWENDTKR